jgi:hypothetical protein
MKASEAEGAHEDDFTSWILRMGWRDDTVASLTATSSDPSPRALQLSARKAIAGEGVAALPAHLATAAGASSSSAADADAFANAAFEAGGRTESSVSARSTSCAPPVLTEKQSAHRRSSPLSSQASPPVIFNVCPQGMKASIVIEKCIGMIEHLRWKCKNLLVFKIGLCTEPSQRWKLYDKEDRYSSMRVLYHGQAGACAFLGSALIKHFEGVQGCDNIAKGGEGCSNLAIDRYVYVVVRSFDCH